MTTFQGLSSVHPAHFMKQCWPCLCKSTTLVCLSVLTRGGNPGNSCQGAAISSPCPLIPIARSTSLYLSSSPCGESLWCSSVHQLPVQQLTLIPHRAPKIRSGLCMIVNMCLYYIEIIATFGLLLLLLLLLFLIYLFSFFMN